MHKILTSVVDDYSIHRPYEIPPLALLCSIIFQVMTTYAIGKMGLFVVYLFFRSILRIPCVVLYCTVLPLDFCNLLDSHGNLRLHRLDCLKSLYEYFHRNKKNNYVM